MLGVKPLANLLTGHGLYIGYSLKRSLFDWGFQAQCSKGGPDASWELKPGMIKGRVSCISGLPISRQWRAKDLGTSNTTTISQVLLPQDQAQRHDSDLNIHFPKRMSSHFTSLNTTSRLLFTANMKEALPDPT